VIDQVVYGRIGSNQQAILLVLQTPDVEVLGITVERGRQAGGNLTQALRMLELVERPEIPVLLVAPIRC
jgi:inosine-uridine nucleoside N-ribohydrolase